MESRILLSEAELDLFTHLTPRFLSAKELAGKLGVDLRGLTILLDALSAMNLLVKEDETYHCPSSISNLLSSNAPGSILPWVLHMASVWKRWSSLTGIVQEPRSRERFLGPSQNLKDLKAFIGAMHVIASPLASRIVEAVNPCFSRSLLDVGGAMGTYTVAFLQAVPEMKATLFDRREVIEIARQFLSQSGLLHRITLLPGDFYRDEFPGGYDLAFVSAIIHQNSPEENLSLFLKIFRSLEAGGRVVIRDHVIESDRIRPKEGALFAVNMLVSTAGGNTYAFEEIETGLARAGFIRIRLLQAGQRMDALVEAFKP